jgi:hypothetical protein
VAHPAFPLGEDVVVPSALLNGIAKIVYQTTAITADQHRDLENLMSLVFQRGVIFNQEKNQ